MYVATALLAALATLGAAAPMPDAASADSSSLHSNYVCHTGDGSTKAGWPAQQAWGSFDALWARNVPLMKESCGNNGWGANDSPSEIADIRSAIQSVAAATKVDARLILAIMMQESAGCVRVPTTGNGVRNPGLMQDHNGSHSCAGTTPCPQSEIVGMIHDGTAGTSSGPGLQQLLHTAAQHVDAPKEPSDVAYAAARLYNSGSADYHNLDNGLGSTARYASDIANRLTGWTVAAANCNF